MYKVMRRDTLSRTPDKWERVTETSFRNCLVAFQFTLAMRGLDLANNQPDRYIYGTMKETDFAN